MAAAPARRRPIRPSQPARTPIFPASHDPSPLAGLKLVRPPPLRGRGRSSSTPPARRREPGSRDEDPEGTVRPSPAAPRKTHRANTPCPR